MKVLRKIKVATGDILVVQGESGRLEMLSLADYGQHVNLNQNKPVTDGLPLMPLTEKWVLTISTQYGCSMGCEFCDVPAVGPGKNASLEDLKGQILTGLQLHPEVTKTKRLNIHFARMGEPTWNPGVVECAVWLKNHLDQEYHIHPVVSTMMPRSNNILKNFLSNWMFIKNVVYEGNAGLQISINSTDSYERRWMFSGNALLLDKIADMMWCFEPKGRKITLNFAVANYTVDAKLLASLFPPKWYVCKLTPMHKTQRALRHAIQTKGDYTTPEPYKKLEAALLDEGYDVLVFIASREEDEGRITCGNAILSGTMPDRYTEEPVETRKEVGSDDV